VLPLCLIWWSKPDRLLALIMFTGLFPAASVVALGSLGIQPSLAPALAFMSYVVLQYLLRARYSGDRDALQGSVPFLLVVAWTVAGSMLLPRLFADAVLVWPQKNDSVGARVLLQPTFGNITQDCYLFLNAAVFLLAACYMTKRSFRIGQVYTVYIYGGWFLVGVCFWQMAHRLAHIPFPETLFYSNPSWAILNTQMAGPVPRINATFTEPAACASYLSGVIFSAIWLTVRGYRRPAVVWLIPAAILALMITTSTTGFAALAIGAMLLPAYALLSGSMNLFGRLAKLAMLGLGVAGVGVLVLLTVAPNIGPAAMAVVQGTASKQDSDSYRERSQADHDSMVLGLETFGLGAGWGSNRASSLIPSLVSTIGYFGVAGLLTADWLILRNAMRMRHRAPQSREGMVIDGMVAALLGRIVAACLSGPTLGMPDFYLMMALVVAATVRIRRGSAVALA